MSHSLQAPSGPTYAPSGGRRLRWLAAAALLFGATWTPMCVEALGTGKSGTGKSSAASESRRSASSATTRDVSVSRIRGRAFRIKPGGVHVSLAPGAAVDFNQPLSVGPKSRMDLLVAGRGELELGPGARLILHPAGREGGTRQGVSALRLEQGYLRIRLERGKRKEPFEVSFGRWLALLEPGEYVFDTRESESAVCTLTGSLRMSGVPDWTPPSVTSGCVRVAARPPIDVTMAPADWERVDARRALLPVVAGASRRESKEAIARLEAEYAVVPPRGPAAARARMPDDASSSAGPSQAASLTQAASLIDPVPGVDAPPEPTTPLPRTRRIPVALTQPLPTAPIESMARRVDRNIAREQARLADALVASTAQQRKAGVVEQAPTPGAKSGAVGAQTPPVIAIPFPDEPASNAQHVALAPPPGHVSSSSGKNARSNVMAAPIHEAAGADAAAASRHLVVDVESVPSTASAPPGPTVSPTADTRPSPTAPVLNEAAVGTAMPSMRADAPTLPPATSSLSASLMPATPAAPPPVDIALASSAGASPTDFSANQAPPQATPPLEWIINVETFPSLESAERQAEQLRSQNFLTDIRRETVRGRSSYRVVIEGLATEHAANSVLHMLVSRLGFRQAWVLRKS